jgi:DNA-binding CsgD family transcriptional regulator
MGITLNTVRTYIRRIYKKLEVQSRTAAVIKYLSTQEK